MAEVPRSLAPLQALRTPPAVPQLDGCEAAPALLHEDGAIFTSFRQDISPYVAEFVGTFLLVLTFLLNYSDSRNEIWAGISNALMNMVLKYAFNHLSGANLNPSLTISLYLSGRMRFRVASRMVLVQIAGACCAGSLRFSIGNTNILIGPKPGHSWGQVAFIEVVYTSLLSFVFLCTAASTRNNPTDDKNGNFGLAVGCAIIAGSYAGMDFCYPLMNSAVAVGATIVDFRARGSFSMAAPGYFFHDILGAFLGTWFYRLLRPEEFDPTTMQQPSARRTQAARYCAESLGTFYVVLTKCLTRTTRHSTEPWAMMGLTAALVFSLRDVSGAFFNPALTLSALLSRRGVLDVRTAVTDCFFQLFSGVIASGFAAGIARRDVIVRFSSHPSLLAIIVTESAFTGLLCYVVLATSVDMPVPKCRTKQNNIAGLAYGSCHLVAGMAARNISGSLLNPVVVLAFSELEAIYHHRERCLLYIIWELVGAIVATLLFMVTHAHLYRGDTGDARVHKTSSQMVV